MKKGNNANKVRKFWFFLMAVTSAIYIGWRILFTLPLDCGIVSVVAGLALLIAEIISVAEALINLGCMSSGKEIELPDLPDEMYPDIDVLVATHSEDAELLLKTINGCRHMNYPDRSKVHIYLCDDMNRPEISALAAKMKVGYFGLAENKYAKAGNLNNAIGKTSSPLIVTFDADMIPRAEFLMKTVPYFFLPKMICENGIWRMRTEDEVDKNYKIGFIQTPQSFYNPDLFQFNFFAESNIPNEQDYFFREVNLGRNATNSAIYAGSNTVISREALEEVGGIRVGTITEDFATGIDIQTHGYTCYAVNTVLASGLAPNDFQSLLKQRQRWGRGCVQTVRNIKFWTSKLSILSKLSYLSCLFYWWTFIRRFVYIMSPILYVLFGVLIVKCNLLELACIWLPSYLIYNHSLKLLSGKTRNQRWSNIVDTIIFPYMIVPILLETLGVRLKKFSVTKKEKTSAKTAQIKYAIPHIILLAATIPAIYICIRDMLRFMQFGGVVVLFWLCMNGYLLCMSILFMIGRVNYRSSERYYCNVEVEFNAAEEQRKAITCDISENGFAFFHDFPEYISDKEETVFTVRDRGYSAVVRGVVVHVDLIKDKWKYSVKIVPEDNKDRLEYLQIVYDREPTLATEIRSTAFKDLLILFKKLTSDSMAANRKLPRVELNLNMVTKEGVPVSVVDFNYQYITIKGLDNKECASLEFAPGVVMELEKAPINLHNKNLYFIKNFAEISGSRELRSAISRVLEEKHCETKQEVYA